MESFGTLREILQYRITENPDNYFTDTVWEIEIDLFLKNLHSSLIFIRNEITDEELLWLSEIFEDIAAKTHSMEFIQCIRERAAKVENQEWRRDIQQEIEEWAVPAANGQTIVPGS